MYKKLLSLFLTVAVLLGVLGIPAFAADERPAEPYVKSDTTIDFTVVESKTYAFRFEVVGPRGLEPHIVAGNGNVLRTENVTKAVENGHDVYYFKVRAIGTPGEASAIYTTLPGQQAVKHCTITVGAPYVKSDTTVDFTVDKGHTYAFRFEIVGPQGLEPSIAAGNGNVLRTENVTKTVENGNDVYYFRVRAVGDPGEASAIYTTLPGQKSVKHCTITVTISIFDTGYTGIDVSHHQGKIDWEAVKASGIDFAILRAGYGKNNIDAYFTYNISECNRLGIPVGVYWFSYAWDEESAAEEARYCMNAIAPYKVELPVSCDIEGATVTYAQNYHDVTIDKELATKMVQAFCSTVEDAGYYAINYTNLSNTRNLFDMEALKDYDIWYARYTTNASLLYSGAHLWQYDNSGTVPGISGSVDMDLALLDYPTVIRNAGLNHLTDEAPTFEVDCDPVTAPAPRVRAAKYPAEESPDEETTGGAEPGYFELSDVQTADAA